MPLPTCQCNAGVPIQQQLANIYCALFTIAEGSGGDVTYPLSPTLGGTGVANAAGETITLNGGFALQLTLTGATNVTLPTSGTIQAFDQSLNTGDAVSFASIGTGGVVIGASDVQAVTFNSLSITANGGNTLEIGAGKTLAAAVNFSVSETASGNDVALDFGGGGAPPTGALGVPANAYGTPGTGLLGAPDLWIACLIGGVNGRIPFYIS